MQKTLLEKVVNDLLSRGLTLIDINKRLDTIVLTSVTSDNNVFFNLNRLFYAGLVELVPESRVVRGKMLSIDNPNEWYQYFKQQLLGYVVTYFERGEQAHGSF